MTVLNSYQFGKISVNEERKNMKWKKWKPFLCISTATVLALSTAAYGSQITITPLDQAGNTVSPGGAGTEVSSEGPGGTGSSAGAGVSPSGGSGA